MPSAKSALLCVHIAHGHMSIRFVHDHVLYRKARAVGEYVTAHPDQRPAPFVVLARQLSMAIAYNSKSLDPTQVKAAVRSEPAVSSSSPPPFLARSSFACPPIRRCWSLPTYHALQAAVADRLRKQAKTRAVKEIREVIRDAQTEITCAILRGHAGALAPAKLIEEHLLGRTVKVLLPSCLTG